MHEKVGKDGKNSTHQPVTIMLDRLSVLHKFIWFEQIRSVGKLAKTRDNSAGKLGKSAPAAPVKVTGT